VSVYRTSGIHPAIYDLSLDVIGDRCEPDAFEPNDLWVETSAIPEQPVPGAYDDLPLCIGNTDWYALDAANGQNVQVGLSFVHADNDLGMRLYKVDDDGTMELRTGADTLFDEEFIGCRPSETGTFALDVYRNRGTVVAEYDLDLSVSGDACPEDADEPNDHGSQATSLSPGVISNPAVCVGDEDYYDLGPLGSSDVLTASISFSHTVGDLGMELFRFEGDGSLITLLTADSVSDDEHVSYTVPDGPEFDGKRFGLRVHRSRGAVFGLYDLDVAVLACGSATCGGTDGCCPDGCSGLDDEDCPIPPEDCTNGVDDDGDDLADCEDDDCPVDEDVCCNFLTEVRATATHCNDDLSTFITEPPDLYLILADGAGTELMNNDYGAFLDDGADAYAPVTVWTGRFRLTGTEDYTAQMWDDDPFGDDACGVFPFTGTAATAALTDKKHAVTMTFEPATCASP
jgi:hypothetical protein